MKNKWMVLIITLVSLMQVKGVKAEVDEVQYWSTYTFSKEINEFLSWSNRLGWRQLDINEESFRAGVSPELEYNLGSSKLNFGTRFFYNQKASEEAVHEIRPWMGYGVKQNKVISHSAKYEHRYLGGDADYVGRFRYAIKTKWVISKRGNRAVTFGLASEFFSHLGSMDAFECRSIRWAAPLTFNTEDNVKFELAPFLQTTHDGLFNMTDSYLMVFRLNIKNFIR